jgi:4'-phosphopantetheinyl transferase
MTMLLPRASAIPRDVEIALCRLDEDGDMPLGTAVRWLSPEERDRADRFRLARDRHRFVRARGFLRRTLARRLDRDPRSLALRAAPRGKPFLPDCGLSFNLSHSGGLAALAISETREVGIDIELLDAGPALEGDLAGVIAACFHPNEAAAIAAAPIPRRTFLRFWTAKEALMKLTGEGLALDPSAILLGHEEGRPVAYLAPSRPAATLHGLELSGAVGALALGSEGRTCCAKH